MKRYIHAGGTSSRHYQEHRLVYFSPFLRHVAEGERGRCEDATGALEARQQQDHDVYTQAVNSHKRAAQSKVVRMMVP